MEGMIGDIPWGIGYRSEKFGLISLDDGYVGLSLPKPEIKFILRFRLCTSVPFPAANKSLNTAQCCSWHSVVSTRIFSE
jgi:hypothetical protein